MIEIIKFIQSFSNPFFDCFFQLVTMMGEETFFMVVAAIVFWCIDKEFGYKIGFMCLSSISINICLKDIFKIPRPFTYSDIRAIRLETAGGYSFPSGHTQLASSFWLSLVLKCKKVWFTAFASLMVILVALSRLYLGVHTIFDVAGGFFIALAWYIIFDKIFSRAVKSENPYFLSVIILPVLILMFVFSSSNYFKVGGTILGLYIGWIVESKYLDYDVKADLPVQVIKLALGLGGLLAIKTAFKIILPEAFISDFARYLLMSLWMTIAAPMLFNRIISRGQKTGSWNISLRR